MPRFRDLPLFWKLLVPFATLIVIVGAFGAFVIVQGLNSQARTTLNQNLLQQSLEARALLQQRELYLLESANLAANLEGMADAVEAGDAEEVERLLNSVLALKGDLHLVVATGPDGVGLVEFTRSQSAGEAQRGAGTGWADATFVAEVLGSSTDRKQAGFLDERDSILAIAAPICSTVEGCEPVGTAIVGLDLGQVIQAAGGSGDAPRAGGTALYDTAGEIAAAAGAAPRQPAADVDLEGSTLVRRTEEAGGDEMHTLYAPFQVQGERQGMVAVSLPTEPVFASARDAGLRLAFTMLGALAGIVAIGALLSRTILRQHRPLLETHRALGSGDLSARAPVVSRDEVGELAQGINQMADQLQASHDTLEARVEQRTAEVERLLRERTDFFASLSHELRTPLAVILSEADLMLDDADGPAADAGAAIKNSAGHLLGVVNDILDVARAEAGQLELDITEVSLPDVIEELRPTILGLARGADLNAEVTVASDLPEVWGNPGKLREVILNLVDNAVKYTPGGGEVAVAAAATDDAVHVSVADTGPGIPEEHRDGLFEPFSRVADNRPRRGRSSTGLGLALAKRQVEAMGGDIDFDSVVGDGTTFVVRLAVAEHHERPGGTTRATTAPPHVDDGPELRQVDDASV